MTADVEEGAQLLAVPHDENRHVAGLRRELVAVLGDHSLVPDVLPGRAEDALLLAPEHVGIRVPAPGQGLHQRRSCSRTSQSARNGSTIRYSPSSPRATSSFFTRASSAVCSVGFGGRSKRSA